MLQFNALLVQLLIVLLLTHHHHNNSQAAEERSNDCSVVATAASCGNLGNNIPFPFSTNSSACASNYDSSSFLLSNCSSLHPSWDGFTQTIPRDSITSWVAPTVMAIFSANSSTFIDLTWDSYVISQPTLTYKSACSSTPVPAINLSHTIPAFIDLSTLPNSTVGFSRNNIFLLFNCTASTAHDLNLLRQSLPYPQYVEANTIPCKSYRRQCTLMVEYYAAGQCVQLFNADPDYHMQTQLNLQQAMHALSCTHFQFFVTKPDVNDTVAITEYWSTSTIQLQWTDPDCWSNCLRDGRRGSCVFVSPSHTFEKCTNCTYGPLASDPRFCSDGYPFDCDVRRLFGRFRICNHLLKIIVSVVAVVGTLLILLVLYCCRRIRRRRKAMKSIEEPMKFHRNSAWPPRQDQLSSGSNDSDLDDVLDLNGLAERPMDYSYSSIASATGSFSSKVGEGAFGMVFKGALDDQEIAVKVLEVRSKHSRKQFLNEVAIIGRIHHVNVVRLLGFCAQHEEHDRMLVYEYVVNGSLDAWLFSTSSCTKLAGNAETIKQLDWGQRYGIALGVARGLSYLHQECRHQIVHCDIKPQNILLDACMCPKISDFGLARLMSRNESRVVTLAKGTPGYMAPEFWVGGDIHLGTKADVYSYGMVLLELISGRRNFALGYSRFPAVAFEAAVCSDFDSIIDVRLQAALINMPAAEEQRFLMQQQVRTAVFVALWCIQEQPASRPSMSQVVQYLEGIAAVSEQPPRPPIACTSTTPSLLPILDCSNNPLQLTQISEGR